MLRKLDTMLAGILVGLIIPAIFYFIFIHPKLSRYSFLDEYYAKMLVKLLPILLSRCIFPNALVFFLLLWRNQTNIARGILIITAVLTGVLVIMNFVVKI